MSAEREAAFKRIGVNIYKCDSEGDGQRERQVWADLGSIYTPVIFQDLKHSDQLKQQHFYSR